MSNASPQLGSLGQDLRRLRISRGLRIADLAPLVHRSTGWISQVERDRSQPSYSDLAAFSRAFEIPISELFRHSTQTDAEEHDVLRREQRREITPDSTGALDDLLVPVMGGIEFYRSHLLAHSASELPARSGRLEMGTVLEGAFEIWIGGRHHVVEAGDSFWCRGETLSWLNPHDTPCVMIWVVAPLPHDSDA